MGSSMVSSELMHPRRQSIFYQIEGQKSQVSGCTELHVHLNPRCFLQIPVHTCHFPRFSNFLTAGILSNTWRAETLLRSFSALWLAIFLSGILSNTLRAAFSTELFFFCRSTKMRRYSLSQYCYSNPSFWIEETHHKTHKKISVCRSLASDADFALGFVDHSPFDDILLARDKWLRRVDSLLFSTPFGAIEREPFTVIDRIALEKRTTPFFTTIRRLRSTTAESWDLFAERVEESQFFRDREDYLDDLADRMAALEVGFENLMDFKSTKSQKSHKEWKSQNGGKTEVSYSYSTRRLADPLTVTVPGIREFSTFRAEKYAFSDRARASEPQTRVIPVEEGEGSDHRNSAASKKIQGVFARKRAAAAQVKGKRKELSPQDAALIIQARFREYLVHRSQTLRSLRDLAVAKAKLKELRTLFSNYSYRRHLCRDPEERQRFSEKTIVVLLTVDSIQGSDALVREARRSMIQELESMLDVVDPQPSNKAGAGRRRKFDLPESGPVNTGMEMEVSEVVGMLDEKNGGNLFPYVTL